jgi:hypothetical protein
MFATMSISSKSMKRKIWCTFAKVAVMKKQRKRKMVAFASLTITKSIMLQSTTNI